MSTQLDDLKDGQSELKAGQDEIRGMLQTLLQEHTLCRSQVGELRVTVFGNGRAGLKDDMGTVKAQQAVLATQQADSEKRLNRIGNYLMALAAAVVGGLFTVASMFVPRLWGG